MNKIKVLYDHQIFSNQNYGGISRYHIELINKFLANEDYIIPDISVLFSNNSYLHGTNKFKPKYFFKENEIRGKTRLLGYINKINTEYVLRKNNFNIFHPTYYDPYFLRFIGDKPYVLTIHDLIHKKFKDESPESSLISNWIDQLMYNASKIVAISENTKKDIKEFYDITDDNIEVIYHGTSMTYDNHSISKLALPDNYLLYVGDRYERKNFRFFVNAIRDLLLSNNRLFLVCAGGNKFTENETKLLLELGINDKVIHLKFNNDQELSELYRKARLFIFPSKYEGFGIPILESFACGCPVALSDSSCFPEIAVDAGLYFDPYNSESIKNTIETALNDNDLLNKCRDKGINRVKDFSWEKAARKTNNLYMSAV